MTGSSLTLSGYLCLSPSGDGLTSEAEKVSRHEADFLNIRTTFGDLEMIIENIKTKYTHRFCFLNTFFQKGLHSIGYKMTL